MSMVVQKIQILNRGFDGFTIAISDIEKFECGFRQQVISMHICVILENVKFMEGASRQILCNVRVRVEWGRRVCDVVFHLVCVNVEGGSIRSGFIGLVFINNFQCEVVGGKKRGFNWLIRSVCFCEMVRNSQLMTLFVGG